ncbi:MAG: hypothetical protein ABIW38_15590, partial [Ferruginibacter sp.]
MEGINCTLKNPVEWLTRFKLLIMLVFFSTVFIPTKLSAQQTIDGNPIDWCNFGSHFQDAYGHGVVDSSFTQGSKDFKFAIDNTWEVGQTKAKNDIANGAASLVTQVRYYNASNVLVTSPIGNYLVFAGDRSSNNGDAQIGFWFYLNGTHPVVLNGSNTFAPEHVRGDLLVLADFTGGGRNGNVSVYRWVGGEPVTLGSTYVPNSNNNLETTNISGAVAENNATSYPVPCGWDFFPRNYETNEFYEGYIDLSLVVGISPCFSTVLLETRSSQSITASLDDFIGGALGGVPSVTLNGGTRCANGAAVTLTAVPGTPGSYTYTWTAPAGVTIGNVSTFNATVGGTYTVYITNNQGCPSPVATATVTVNPLPGCDITGNQAICANQSTSFTATGGAAGATYSWSGPAGYVNSNAANSGTLTVAGAYTVLIT